MPSPPTIAEIFVALHAALAVATAAHALMTVRDPRAAWGWIAVCWLAPLAGVALYLLLGTNRVRSQARRALRYVDLDALERGPAGIDARLPDVIGEELRELVRIGGAVSRRNLTHGNRIQLLHNGEQCYPAMLDAIAGAQKRIWMSSYIFAGDTVGQRFASALEQARQRGVDVRVLIDAVGDLYYWPRGSALLRRRGIDVRRFQLPRQLPLIPHVNLRNHRKLLIVDERTAFTGGLNIGRQHLHDSPRPTIDLHARYDGPVTAQLAEVFAEDWRISGGEPLGRLGQIATEHGTSYSRAITEGPNEELDRLELILMGALANAHRRVWIMTPYFIPTPELARALEAAALRGVEVAVLLPQRSNLPWVDWATRHWLRSLLARQVRVFLRPAPFAHSKLLLVDDYYSHIGSANLDPRSLRLNFELVVENYCNEFAAELAAHFEATRSESRELTHDALITSGIASRLRDALCWLFSPYL
jgi:cardiolipin synthase